MRTRIFLVFVGLSVLLSTEVLLGKKGEAPSKLSVRQQMDSEIHNLKRNLELVKKSDESWKALEKTEKQIRVLRSQNPRQFERDEIYMDTVMAGLESIPRKNNFKKDDCENYRNQILVRLDPHGEEKPSPPVAQSLDILKSLCR